MIEFSIFLNIFYILLKVNSLHSFLITVVLLLIRSEAALWTGVLFSPKILNFRSCVIPSSSQHQTIEEIWPFEWAYLLIMEAVKSSFESMRLRASEFRASVNRECYISINRIKIRKSIASTPKRKIIFHVPTSSFEKIKTTDRVQRRPNLDFNPRRFIMCTEDGEKYGKAFFHWWFILVRNVWNSGRESNTVWKRELMHFKFFTPGPYIQVL